MSGWVRPVMRSMDRMDHAGAARSRATLSVKAHARFWTGYRFGVFATFTNSSCPSARPSKSVSVALGLRRMPRGPRSRAVHEVASVPRMRTSSIVPTNLSSPSAYPRVTLDEDVGYFPPVPDATRAPSTYRLNRDALAPVLYAVPVS